MPAGPQPPRYRVLGDASSGPAPARDEVLERDVLVLTAPSSAAAALAGTAKRLAKLEHAGIPVVHDFVHDEAGAILVMGRTEGISLAAAIADAREGLVRPEIADPAAALGLMVRVCESVTAAHERGFRHGSLRTALITIGRNGDIEVGGWESAPEQGQGDLYADIRALGSCLFEVLALRPPTPGGDPFRDLSPTEEMHVPEPVMALVRRAVASDVTTGYRSVDELRVDLARVCGKLRLAAHAAASAPRIGRRGRRILVATLVALALGAAGAAVWHSYAASSAAAASDRGWDAPIVREDFADDSWRGRWRAPVSELGAMWQMRDGRLVSTAAEAAHLIFRQRLSVPVAIEYTGQILPGERPGDLSVIWREDEDVVQVPGTPQPPRARTYLVQAAAYENSYCGIFGEPGGQRLAYAPRQLTVGVDHRFRVEIDEGRMSLAIDGEPVVEYRERFATTSGHIELYAHFPGKAFDDVTIQGRPLTDRISPLAMGDVMFTYGHFADAATVYARLSEGVASERIVQEAIFRKGLAERRAGLLDASRETWAQLLDPALAQAAEAIRLEELLDTGQEDLFRERLAAAWRRSPAAHDELRRQWQIAVGRARSAKPIDQARADALLRLRDQLFPGDQTSGYEVANLLLALGRYQQVLSDHPRERRACIGALLALGRADEAEKAGWLVPMDRVTICLMRGAYRQLATMPEAPVYHRAFALCKAGAAAEVVGDAAEHPAKLYLGKAAELVANPKLFGGMVREALVCLGRLEEAAGDGLPGREGSGHDPVALALLGRIAEAEAVLGQPRHDLRLIAALASGDREAAKRARAGVVPPTDRSGSAGWFSGMVLGPFADRLAGDPGPLDASLKTMADGWAGVYADRARIFAAAVLGRIDDAAVLAQPTASESAAWRALAAGLRAELAGDQAQALRGYAAFQALPMSSRLLFENVPDPAIENFVAWRLRALGR